MLLELHLLCTESMIYFFGENIKVLHILSKFLYCHKLKNTAIYFYFVYNFLGASWGGLLSVYCLQWWKCVRCINIFCDWIANWTMERIIKLWKRHEIFCKVLLASSVEIITACHLLFAFICTLYWIIIKVNLLWHHQVKDLSWL